MSCDPTFSFEDFMKTIISLLLSLLVATSAQAKETVSIIWPFSIGSNQANFVRAIIEESNKQQTKYNFIVEFKPGAGGSVAANFVHNSRDLTLISSSSSFFIRPLFYPNESHRPEDFKPVYVECLGQPLAISSIKYKSIDEVKKQKRVTIGVLPGSLTEAGAKEFRKLVPNTEVDLIPYNGTLPILQDLIAGTLDLGVNFASESKQWVDAGKLNVLGISGTKDFEGFKSFTSQKITGFEELANNYLILIPARYPDSLAEELHNIFRRGAKASTTLKGYYDLDLCSGVDYNWRQTQDVFKRWQSYWPTKIK